MPDDCGVNKFNWHLQNGQLWQSERDNEIALLKSTPKRYSIIVCVEAKKEIIILFE